MNNLIENLLLVAAAFAFLTGIRFFAFAVLMMREYKKGWGLIQMPCITEDRYQKLMRYEAEEQRCKEIARERFRVKSKCDLCGYESIDIYPNQNSVCPSLWCEGSMEALK